MITGNEPATPLTHEGWPSELDVILKNIDNPCIGLTIRQKFAMAAMQGLLSDRHHSDTQGSPEMIAGMALACADALIAELNKSESCPK